MEVKQKLFYDSITVTRTHKQENNWKMQMWFETIMWFEQDNKNGKSITRTILVPRGDVPLVKKLTYLSISLYQRHNIKNKVKKCHVLIFIELSNSIKLSDFLLFVVINYVWNNCTVWFNSLVKHSMYNNYKNSVVDWLIFGLINDY